MRPNPLKAAFSPEVMFKIFIFSFILVSVSLTPGCEKAIKSISEGNWRETDRLIILPGQHGQKRFDLGSTERTFWTLEVESDVDCFISINIKNFGDNPISFQYFVEPLENAPSPVVVKPGESKEIFSGQLSELKSRKRILNTSAQFGLSAKPSWIQTKSAAGELIQIYFAQEKRSS
jgi:hypothetical protein